MVTEELQSTIETLYRIDGSLSVADYRIDGRTLEVLLGKDPKEHREMLVVHHDGEYTNLSLYISDEVLIRARTFLDRRPGPEETGDLDAFCAATEGVSHFVYFTFCGEQLDRPVSQIELELQAEIDKFLVVRLFAPVGADLIPRLFEQIRLLDRLTLPEQERYVVANRAGRRYARWLDREIAHGRAAMALEDARMLYRKPLAAKLDHIARAA
jgi:hypothetical protein